MPSLQLRLFSHFGLAGEHDNVGKLRPASAQMILSARAATDIDPLSFIAAMNPPLSARMPKYDSNFAADAGRVHDGIFYIDRTATKLN